MKRRSFLSTATAAIVAPMLSAQESTSPVTLARVPNIPPSDYRIQHGKIRHSVMGWCFNPIPTEELIEACHRMGMTAMEGIDSKFYPELQKRGMKPSLVGSHGFGNGPTDPKNHQVCIDKLREGIDLAVKYGSKSVITFTGMVVEGLSREQMIKNCLQCWAQVLPYAEEKGIDLCLEHLNTRDDSHPMKGHPGYFGDHLDFCAELVHRTQSPKMKLLFDIYHVQIMDGDVIRRLREHIDIIGHIHTAGAPGRAELDDTQEINYPAVMRAILELGYTGYTAHEFIPTWEDKLGALRHGVQTCDVTL